MNRMLIAALAAAIAGPVSASAQQAESVEPRWSGASFAAARYVAGKSATVLAGQRVGPAMVVVGAKGTPTSSTWSPMVGPGARVRVARGIDVTTILVFLDAPAGASLDLYASPSIRMGGVRLDGQVMLRQPLDHGRPRELSINPVTLSAPVIPGVRVGLGATVTAVQGRPARAGPGVVGVIGIGRGTVTAELMVRDGRLEKRLGYVIRF